MTKKTPEPAAPAPDALPGAPVPVAIDTGDATSIAPDPFAHVGDEFWGQGGRFIVDENGKRVPAPLNNDTEADHG